MKILSLSALRRAARSLAQSDAAAAIGGRSESTESTMIEAHKAGMAYWRQNRPVDATRENLASHARTCGWHGADNKAWLAGYYGAKRRDTQTD